MSIDFETKLEQYAKLAVHIGLNVQPGQRVLVNAPIEAAPFARRIAKYAYQRGARLVEVLYRDDELMRTRFVYAPRDSFEVVPEGQVAALLDYASKGDARCYIDGTDPNLLSEFDPALVIRQQKAYVRRVRVAQELAMRDAYPWLVIAAPVASWAAQVFSDVPPAEQIIRLWEAILSACRVTDDAIAEWATHTRNLRARCEFLNAKQYAALHYRAPGTALRVGLLKDHIWIGGATTTPNGISFVANLPTEEVYTMPHCEQIDGVVTSTVPLSVHGTLIQKFSLRFENGRVIAAEASNGQEMLDKLLDTDAGARSLGEVALVPNTNPVVGVGRLFYNGLFDENASCHLALGQSYPVCVSGGSVLNEDELRAIGGNASLEHLDFMVGSGEMDIDGELQDGTREPVMRRGEWAFEL